MVLRVKLEIVPLGDETKAHEIGRLDIFNKGKTAPLDNECYAYGVIELTPANGGLHLEEVYHYRQEGAWRLVREVLEALQVRGP